MTDPLIESRLSSRHTNAAIEAILKFTSAKQAREDETSMFGASEDRISLSFTKKKIHPQKDIDPRAIPLAHPIVDPRKTQICLIVKDPQREYKDLLEQKNIKFIGRVVGIAKLKGKWKGFEERRQLLRENGLFLVDDRVAAMMPMLLGKMWFKAKKQPLPVNMQAKDLKSHLERAINNTFLHDNSGKTVTVKIGTTSLNQQQLYDNICTSLPKIVAHIHGGWENIQNVYLSVTGISLPVWSCDLGANSGGRWDGMTTAQPEAWGGFGGIEIAESPGESSDAESASGSLPPSPRADKGKKRALTLMGGDEIQTKKSKAAHSRAKSSLGAVDPIPRPRIPHLKSVSSSSAKAPREGSKLQSMA